jgi:hypothetical protein
LHSGTCRMAVWDILPDSREILRPVYTPLGGPKNLNVVKFANKTASFAAAITVFSARLHVYFPTQKKCVVDQWPGAGSRDACPRL